MKYALITIATLVASPVYAGSLASQGLADPVVTPPAKCWLIPGILPCHDRGKPCPINEGSVTGIPSSGPTPGPNPGPTPTPGPNPTPETPSGKAKGNNGWGNGDQSAPGNSRQNNNAENKDGNSQRNHGNARPN